MNCRYRIVYFNGNEEYIDEVIGLFFEGDHVCFLLSDGKVSKRKTHSIDFMEVDVAQPAEVYE